MNENKIDAFVLTCIIFSMLSETLHMMPQLHHVHSVFKGISVYWDDVIYYFLAQIGKVSLLMSIVLVLYSRRKNKATKAISLAQLFTSILFTIDEILYLLQINREILYLSGTHLKVLFLITVITCTYIFTFFIKNDSS